MKISGIICEYNPFHYGHKYQLDEVKKESDAVVCIMSGSFVQRGDVAVFDKWTRARAALKNGADLVIELPAAYSLSSAPGFAQGAVLLLDSMGIIDDINFGSECGDTATLEKAAEILLNEPRRISVKIKENTALGMSYPKARQKAYSGIIDDNILAQPNNILALEYILALKKLNSKIVPTTLKRSFVGFHSMTTNGKYASATLLRDKLKNSADISDYSPFDYSGCITYDIDRLSDIFRYKLLSCGKSAFSGIADIEKGLDDRFLKAIDRRTISEINASVKTKRYTMTRIRRITASVLLSLGQCTERPDYIRVLGMNENGKKILAEMKKKASFPIINKVADYRGSNIKTDILATDLAALCADSPVPFGRDFTTSPVII